jgi:hypothetical protein
MPSEETHGPGGRYSAIIFIWTVLDTVLAAANKAFGSTPSLKSKIAVLIDPRVSADFEETSRKRFWKKNGIFSAMCS